MGPKREATVEEEDFPRCTQSPQSNLGSIEAFIYYYRGIFSIFLGERGYSEHPPVE